MEQSSEIQSSEIQSRLVSLGERLTALDNRVNEFIPDINTKVGNLSEGVHRLELQIQPLAAENKNLALQMAAENKNLSERMDNMAADNKNLAQQTAADNKNISKEIHNLERQMSAENKNLERQMSAENKNLALQVAAENKKLALQMAAENKNLSLQIQPLVDDCLNAKKIRTIVIGGAIVAVSGALASGLFAAL